MLFDCVVTRFLNEHFGPGIPVKTVPPSGGLKAPGVTCADVRKQQMPVGSFITRHVLSEWVDGRRRCLRCDFGTEVFVVKCDSITNPCVTFYYSDSLHF